MIISGYQLLASLVSPAAAEQVPDMPVSILFFGIFISTLGMISIIYPRIFWYLRVGRKLKGAAPGKLYLWVIRFGGILVLAMGLFMIYSANLISF